MYVSIFPSLYHCCSLLYQLFMLGMYHKCYECFLASLSKLLFQLFSTVLNHPKENISDKWGSAHHTESEEFINVSFPKFFSHIFEA